MACGRDGWKVTIAKMSYQADHGLQFRLKILCLEGRSMEAAALAADVIFEQAVNKCCMELMGASEGGFNEVEVDKDESLPEQLVEEPGSPKTCGTASPTGMHGALHVFHRGHMCMLWTHVHMYCGHICVHTNCGHR